MKWEYRIISLYELDELIIVKNLNKFGEDGWELANAKHVVVDDNIEYLVCILKRQING